MFSQKGIAQPLLLLILIVGIIISVIVVQNRTNLFPKASTSGAILSISPPHGIANQGCDFSIDINLDTGGFDTFGTDIVLMFDPAILEAASLQGGSLYANNPPATIDNTGGKIRASGLASPSSPYNGAGKFASVNFKVKPGAQTGSTPITFDFDPNNTLKTNDTNVVEANTLQDRLNSVGNADFQIGTGTCQVSSSQGDINGDSKIDENDLSELQKYLGIQVPNVQKSDLNSDGIIDNADVEILTGLLGISSSPSPSPIPTPTPIPSAKPLSITNVSDSAVTQTSAIIKWKTNYPGTTRVSFGKTQSNLNITTTNDGNLVLVHQATLNNLNRNTKYFYKVYSKNSAGAEYSSGIGSFTTKR